MQLENGNGLAIYRIGHELCCRKYSIITGACNLRIKPGKSMEIGVSRSKIPH